MTKKRKCFAAGVIILLAVLAAVIIPRMTGSREESKNLALGKGVKVVSDSVETEELSADKAIDGDDETLSSRWSSENNWENASHYIELEFPEEISVSFVVLKWERRNVISYQLEASLDGKNWTVLEAFNEAPELKRQEIALAKAETVKFLRLSTNAVSQNEEDYSNLYQNVSLYEFEVYADKPAAYYVKEPEIVVRDDKSRYLKMPEAPEGYELTYLGADYEQVIGADGEIYDTIQDKEVTVGFLIESIADKEEAEEFSFTIMVPAVGKEAWESSINVDESKGVKEEANKGIEEDSGKNVKNEAPKVIPAIAEWNGSYGVFEPDEHSRLIIEDESLMQTAELFVERYKKIMGDDIEVVIVKDMTGSNALAAGDFYLAYGTTGAVTGVGDEGYVCGINDICVINGSSDKGIYWGTITVLQILKTNEGQIPKGIIRDYPKYPVRGFGIDVARKPVSMAMLYQIVENMSWYKMNDLSIHLNDNEILSTSGLTDSSEEVMTAYSAFRINTSVINDNGVSLTAEDYAYTADEFAQFINDAKAYGVGIVPEIDTPAHSLSITRLFPEYALKVNNESLDQLNLSKKKAVELVKNIWREVLNGSGDSGDDAFDGGEDTKAAAAFSGVDIVNIGMDEYYGDGETYRRYMNEIIGLVKDECGVETVRMWGSLSNMEGSTMPSAEGLQMNIWSDIWANPLEMYEEGYSLINMQNNHLYIIAGGGYDYLDTEELYQNWEPEKFYDNSNLEYIPSYSPKMLGASYMIWNDMSGSLDVGICEVDLFDRFFNPLGIISTKTWGGGNGELSYEECYALFENIGYAPESNPYAVFDTDAGGVDDNYKDKTFSLKGKTDYVTTGYMGGNGNGIGIGGDYSISFEVYRVSDGLEKNGVLDEQILFETDSAYGQTAFIAVQAENGKVGFSREGRSYSFDYTLPEEEWIKLTICGKKNQTRLYVDDELIGILGDDEPFSEYATFVFPFERIGSKTNAFCGMIKNIEIKTQ